MKRLSGGIGTRVVVTVLVLCIAVLTLAGLSVYTISRAQIDTRVDRELALATDEVRVLASQGVDPKTRQLFANPDDLLRVAVQRSVLGRHEGEFAVVDGAIRWVPPLSVPLRLNQDAAFVAATMPLTAGDLVVQGSVQSGEHEWRYIVVPVTYADAGRGALVRAYDVAPDRAELASTFRSYAVVGGIAVLLVAAAVLLLMGRLLVPLRLVRETAQRISGSDLGERIPLRGDDELTALTVTVNDMLDRLETAVTNQKRLLDDVSHELRTPLTIMRGNLDLLDATNPADVEQTRATLLGVVERMERLVNDLLTLAHADRDDFVRPIATDAAQLTDEVAELARPLGNRRWQLDHLADVIVNLDPQRVQQAMLQLVSNAVKYSEPDTSIRIGSSVDGNDVCFYVQDQGIGIPAESMPDILTRFGRAENARAAFIEGSGLGLAIVDSIARAHGGWVDVESAAGVGSRFTIRIPMKGHA